MKYQVVEDKLRVTRDDYVNDKVSASVYIPRACEHARIIEEEGIMHLPTAFLLDLSDALKDSEELKKRINSV